MDIASIDIAFSPCPNDTFLIGAWVNGNIESTISPIPHYLDIQELNRHALANTFAVTKMSTNCFGRVQGSYELLPIGAAIGMDVGPKLIAREKSVPISECVIAHPGTDTTAYALLKILLPAATRLVFMSYEKIIPAIAAGHIDAGVIIHESRFTFQKYHLVELLDLGEEYIKKYNCPIPLGVVCAKKSLPQKTKDAVIDALTQSIQYAHHNLHELMPYIQQHAQELDSTIIKRHIDLYVTKDTYLLSQAARDSITTFLGLYEA